MTSDLAAIGLIATPLAAGLLCFVMHRGAFAIAMLAALAQCGLAVWLALAVWNDGPMRYPIGGWGAPLGIELAADGLTAVMLLMTAGVGIVVAVYAQPYFALHEEDSKSPMSAAAEERPPHMFWPLCLMLWAALNGLFLSGDIFNLYVTLELLTISAVALVGLAGKVEALGAALRYLLVAIAASLFYLLGVVLLYSIYGTIDWRLLAERFEGDVPSLVAIALICVGLMTKTAVFPLHFWLPAAHGNAPAPASALLSALVLKASYYVMFRLWFEVFPYETMRLPGELIGALGMGAIVWGSLQAIRQRRAKLLIAYSTVAQIGYLFLVFALAGQASVAWGAWSASVYLALSHACAKGAAFLAVGALQHAAGSDELNRFAGAADRQPVVVLAFGIAAVSLMGLPPSGAFIGKWMLLTVALESARWEYALVILLGGLLAGVYVFRVIASTFHAGEGPPMRPVPKAMQYAPLVLAVASLVLGLASVYPLELLEVGAPVSAMEGSMLE